MMPSVERASDSIFSHLRDYKEVIMLALRFSRDDYAFVFSGGRPIGAIIVGENKGRSQLSLFFAGQETDFEILRPQAVQRRFGREELEKLRSRFLPPSFTARKPEEPTISALGAK
jgi:hypothetical protein